jgi:VWFA-related protein
MFRVHGPAIRRATLTLMATALWLAPRVDAQQVSPQSPQLIPRTQDERDANYREEHRFILNVRVGDGAGKAATGLQLSDFTLLDNGSEERIASLREAKGVGAPVPPRVMLLLDEINLPLRDLRTVHDGIERFLSRDDEPVEFPTSLALLTETGVTVTESTTDRQRLRSDLASLSQLEHPTSCDAALSPEGHSTAHLDCLSRKFTTSVPLLAQLAHKEEETPGRLILVWFGPGWPHLSNAGFTADTAQAKQNFFEYLIELSDALRVGQVTLDALTLARPRYKPDTEEARELEAAESVRSEKDATAASLSLPALAIGTGGMILDGAGDLPAKIAACMADAESYYVLAFDSAIEKAPGEYHSIEVRIDKPGLTARAVKYYYAAP